MNRSIALAGLWLLLAAPATAEDKPADGLRPGLRFKTDVGSRVAGWDYSGGSLWGDKFEHCCIAFFSRGRDIMLAVSQRDPADKSMETLTAVQLRLSPRKEDQIASDCVLDGKAMLIAIHDPRSGKVAGYTTDGKRFIRVERALAGLEGYCDFAVEE